MNRDYLNSLLASAEQALGDGTQTRFIRVAGDAVRIDFADLSLCRQLFPALAHLEIDPAAQSLRIIVVSGDQVAAPEPPASARELAARGERWGSNLRGGDSDAPRVFSMPPPNAYLCALDPENATAVYHAPTAAGIPYYERGSPLRTLFDWWLENRGLLLTHAACVGDAAGGALVVGHGGRGKSTAAISSLLGDTLGYLSDDYLVLSMDDGPRAHSLYSTGKLDADHIEARLPQLAPLLDNALAMPAEKGLFFFHRHLPDRIRLELPLRLAILPVVTGCERARLVPTTPGRLLIGLAASTLYQSTGAGEDSLRLLREVIGELPCYLLETGADLDSIAPCIAAGIAHHAHD